MAEVITNNLDLWTSALLTKSTAGRGSNGKQETYGIKKIRELILELAVRGKLVPQDPRDEPASVLLKKVEKEIGGLINEGELKKEKTLPEISDEEKLFEQPQGWDWTRFGSIAKHNSGKTLDRGRNIGQLRDYITTSNLYWGRFDLDNIRQMPIADNELEKCTARKGDLLICEGGEAGRAAVWEYDYDICVQNHVHRARFYGKISPYFIYRFFEKLNATGEIDQHRKGVGISNMSSKALSLIVVPLPPLAEQHRIVAKVDELMALCDQLEEQQTQSIEAHQTLVETLLDTLTRVESQQELSEAWARIANHFDALFTTEHSIDQLKQTILQLAVMGKLVPQNPNDEPANVLLKKIRSEKTRLIEERKMKKDKPLPDWAKEEVPYCLPSGWSWTKFEDVVEITSGITLGRKVTDKKLVTLPYLRVANVQRGYLELNVMKEIELPEEELEKFKIMDRDLLITEGGDWDKVGRTAIWRNELPLVAHQNHVFKARRILKEQNELWLEKYLNSEVAREYFAGSSKQTTNLASINKTQLRRLPIAIPPLKEQHRIVAKVDELMALCDSLKAHLADAKTTKIHLADAIVEQVVA